MKPITQWLSFVCVFVVLTSFPAEGGSMYIVDRLTDNHPTGGGQGSGQAGDLRYCITRANARPGRDLIRFRQGSVGTIWLAAPLPTLADDLAIRAPGANRLRVRGGGSTVFRVASGVTVALSGLKITGGVGNGGGIFNAGTLTLYRATISGNVAGDPTNGGGTGGGIWNYVNATLILNSCTVSGNSALGNSFYNPSRGGGIANYGTLTLNSSTVSGNAANYGFGGGINNSGTLTLNNSTVSHNAAAGGGGGVSNSGTFTPRNTIVARNQNTDLVGNLTSRGYNLFGTTRSRGFAPTDVRNVNPLLGRLQNNGGPTLTHALRPGSPAIDAGNNTNAPRWDQRAAGFPRVANGTIDIGSFEVQ